VGLVKTVLRPEEIRTFDRQLCRQANVFEDVFVILSVKYCLETMYTESGQKGDICFEKK
jgi:hypothetical protein